MSSGRSRHRVTLLSSSFLLGKDFQGSKLKVTLARKKGPMNSMRGGMPPREQRGMPPPLRGGNRPPPREGQGRRRCGRCLLGLTEPSLQVPGGLGAQGGPAAPWVGWEAEVETGAASPREDRGDPGETPPAGASSTELATGSVPIRKYPAPLVAAAPGEHSPGARGPGPFLRGAARVQHTHKINFWGFPRKFFSPAQSQEAGLVLPPGWLASAAEQCFPALISQECHPTLC